MRLFVGLLLFWLSNIGYINYLVKAKKIPTEFALPLVFTVEGISIFIAGLLNILTVSVVIIFSLGIFLLIKALIKKDFCFKNFFKANSIIIIVIIFIITIMSLDSHLLHYDNFSHWGLILKDMFLNNRLPNFESDLIMFKNYQPGSASFLYYTGYILGKTESSIIIAQNYLIIAYYFSILALLNKLSIKNKSGLRLLIISVYLFFIFGNIMFYDLLVDSLLSAIFIFAASIIAFYNDDTKKAFLYLLPISIFMVLIKNTGFVLMLYISLILILLGFKNKERRKGFIFAFLTLLICFTFFYLWTKHVSMVYGASGLESKHSLNISSLILELQNKGAKKIYSFINMYFNNFINLSNNVGSIYMIALNIILFSLLIIFKNRKLIIGYIISINLIYISYYAILGLMYILSMPWEEAIVLASYNRYILTIVYIIIGIVILLLIQLSEGQNLKSFIISSILAILVLVVNVIYNNANLFIGAKNYKESLSYKYDSALSTDSFYPTDDSFYYIYAPVSKNNNLGYLYFLTRYKLFTNNFNIVDNVKEIDVKNKIKLVVIENCDSKEITDYIKENEFSKNGENLYLNY